MFSELSDKSQHQNVQLIQEKVIATLSKSEGPHHLKLFCELSNTCKSHCQKVQLI